MAFPLFSHLPSSSSLSLPKSNLSFLSSSPNPLHHLSFHPPKKTLTLTLPPIRMGGGPRTFPGGVSKWQWKRMQSKKAKQLLKARLLRERQIYEMRKRTELRAAVSELEKPWEMVERLAPNLFSVSADDQVKTLADRFQRPGGFDMWSHRDGPEMFRRGDGGPPSARFFPKGVVHSIKPYGDDAPQVFDDWIARGGGGVSRGRRRRRSISPAADAVDVEVLDGSEVEDVGCMGGVRRNANGNGSRSHQRGGRSRGHSADPCDVEVMDREGVRSNFYEKGNSKDVDRRKYALINRWERVERNDRVNLRPTSDLYKEGGKNVEGNGVRRNNGTRK